MEATYFSETSVDFQRITRRYIPEDRTLHNHRCENLRSYIKPSASYLLIILSSTIYVYGLDTDRDAKCKLKQEVLITFFRFIRHGPHRKTRIQQFFYSYVCILCRGNFIIEPLPSNHRGYTYRQTNGRDL
jgi:hypothetical protein